MRISVLYSALKVLFSFLLCPLGLAHASTPPVDSMPFDYEQWRRDHAHPAAKPLADLDVGEPRTVRMIYFLPNDWPYRADVVDSMKTAIKQVQTFYREQMQAHGYGGKTFTELPTDSYLQHGRSHQAGYSLLCPAVGTG